MELQCSLSQQERVAQLLIETFGDKLYIDQLYPDESGLSNEYRSLPSPNELRGKILIKVKQNLKNSYYSFVENTINCPRVKNCFHRH